MLQPNTLPLPAIPEGWQALHHSILPDGTLAVVVTDVDLASEWSRLSAADGQADPPSRINELTKLGWARLLTGGVGGWQEGPGFPLETPHPIFSRFADGRWLVVGSRTRSEPNARIFAADGALLERFLLGDGIDHIVIDNADRIWVGWFDEGMFGNRGWQVPGHEWPPSSNGVACFTADGALAELPVWPEKAGMIADCYALTPAGSGVWASPYTEFPLVRFVPGKPVRWWRSQLAGPKAIAINGTYALVAGGYGDDAARLVLVQLGGTGNGEDAAPLATWRMPLRPAPPSQNDWSPVWERPALLTGRDDTLHLVDDSKWYQWRVADSIAALANA
jgi:hypothetical protein